MGIFKRWLDRQRRRIDVAELWPACERLANDRDHAKAAFYYHIINDAAWTDHYSETELIRFVNDL